MKALGNSSSCARQICEYGRRCRRELELERKIVATGCVTVVSVSTLGCCRIALLFKYLLLLSETNTPEVSFHTL
jgi:hypothetical protein